MDIKKFINEIPDFPSKGVLFRDIQPILANPEAFNYVVEELSKYCKDADIIVAPDARGFIFGTPVALKNKIPFVMVRKPGKLPGETFKEEYVLEYGTNTLEMAQNIIRPGQKVAIIDDLLAVGGTALAIVNLVKKMGGKVISASFAIELTELNGRSKLQGIEVNSIIKY